MRWDIEAGGEFKPGPSPACRPTSSPERHASRNPCPPPTGAVRPHDCPPVDPGGGRLVPPEHSLNQRCRTHSRRAISSSDGSRTWRVPSWTVRVKRRVSMTTSPKAWPQVAVKLMHHSGTPRVPLIRPKRSSKRESVSSDNSGRISSRLLSSSFAGMP